MRDSILKDLEALENLARRAQPTDYELLHDVLIHTISTLVHWRKAELLAVDTAREPLQS